MESVYTAKENCCGCTACINVCPKGAIDFHIDEMGYTYPYINNELCINCGLCKKTCQFSTPEIQNATSYVRCFALKHKDLEVISSSRSAGAFTAFSDYILNNNGVVYGAKLDEDMVVRHHRATSKNDRDFFRESKYVQSELKDIFKYVESDLKSNKIVMFTGTGCQCDGLRSYLKNKNIITENLILADVVCHGVPSPKMFTEYLMWHKEREHSDVKEFKFRDKEKYTWAEGIEKITFANGKVKYQDYFTGSIFTNFVRPCCYQCKYTTPYRNSDVSFADFWGSEQSAPEFTDYKNGCSLILIHSGKAEKIFNSITDSIKYKEIPVDCCLQPRLKTPRETSPLVDKYWKDYIKYGFNHIIKKYSYNSISLNRRIKKRIVKYIKAVIRHIKNHNN